MPTATVHVKFKDAPGQGKKNWKIKAADNNLYFLKPELADKVMIGGEYTFEYKTNAFNGQNFNMVDTVTAAVPSQTAPQAAQSFGGAKNKEFDRTMFVTAMMKSSLEGGLIKELKSDISISAVQHWCYVYDSTLGKKGQQYSDDMSDFVPF